MNGDELYFKDGKATGIFYCEKCRALYKDKDIAERCCVPNLCEKCNKECEKKFYTMCDSCIEIKNDIKNKEILNKAELIENWDGLVYLEDCGHNEGYFDSIDELEQYLADEEIEIEDIPEYAFCAKGEPVSELSADDIIEREWEEEVYDGFFDNINGLKELQKALDEFHTANCDKEIYHVDYTKKVKINIDLIIKDREE